MKCKNCKAKRPLSGYICPTCGAVTKFPIWLNPLIYFLLAASALKFDHYVAFFVLDVLLIALAVPYIRYNINVIKARPIKIAPAAVSVPRPAATPVTRTAAVPAPAPVYTDYMKEVDERFTALLDSIPRHDIVIADRQKVTRTAYIRPVFSNVTARSNVEKLGNFVVIDTETTGLSASKDAIVEVSAVKFERYIPVAVFESFVNPHRSIPEAASKVNHITDDMVSDAPDFSQIRADLVSFIGSSPIIGHNLDFDLKFLCSAGIAFVDPKQKFFDTLELSRRIIGDCVENCKLVTLCDFYKIRYEGGAHRSSSDALATGLLFRELVDERTRKGGV